MPSSFSHAVAGVGFGSLAASKPMPRRFWVAAGVCGALPDVDLITWIYRVPNDSVWSHRGITHGIPFAIALGWAVAWTMFRGDEWRSSRRAIWAGLTLATASHGLFDSLATYGDAVQFLAPFTTHRFSPPWHPIDGGAGTGGPWGHLAQALLNELLCVWLPSIVLLLVWRARQRKESA